MKYFQNVKSIENLKEQYKKLTKKYHPDLNRDFDTTEIMKAINAEFTELHKRYKTKSTSSETPEEFIEILNKIIHLEGLDIEICGRWIWISGNTFPHKTQLKEAGFHWASKKKMWYWHPEDAACKGSGKTTIEDIRSKYGSQSIESKRIASLA